MIDRLYYKLQFGQRQTKTHTRFFQIYHTVFGYHLRFFDTRMQISDRSLKRSQAYGAEMRLVTSILKSQTRERDDQRRRQIISKHP